MKRWHVWLVVALVPVFGQASVAYARAIYKCTVNGSTVYRDQPCVADRPGVGKLSGFKASLADPVLSNDPGVLMQGLRNLSERDRQLQAQHDRELDQLKLRMAGVRDAQAQRREIGEFNRGWQERFAENRRRREALVDRVKELCPGGASSNSSGHTCRRQDGSRTDH